MNRTSPDQGIRPEMRVLRATARSSRAVLPLRIAAVVALLAGSIAFAAPASASAAAAKAGWLRIAHLSPDTRPLDVSLTALSGATVDVRVGTVAYGAVSRYVSVPVDTYAVRMTPRGSSAAAPPIAEATVQVSHDRASTVAVFGRNGSLRPTVLGDDLRPPTAGHGRVRLVQASVDPDPISVATADGVRLASDVGSGVVTTYANVPTGRLDLTATRGPVTARSRFDLRSGEIVSLFALDDASGGFVLRDVVDTANVGVAPKGFVNTGGGYLAQRMQAAELLGAAIGAPLAALLLGGLIIRQRRTSRAR